MWLLILVLPLVAQLVEGNSIGDRNRICETCGPNEVLSDTLPCCERTCDNDCLNAQCASAAIYKRSCVCQPGFVRHEGQCIPATCCPTTPKPDYNCPCNEELLPTPPCCEPTCSNNCSEPCQSLVINQPTCVCVPGYVRYQGRCIRQDQCPTCGPYATYSPCTPCCESTCTVDCAAVTCLAGCAGPPTCLCQTGYVKHEGICIKQELCPKVQSVQSANYRYSVIK